MKRLSKSDKENRDNLRAIENLLAKLPMVNGVPVCKCFTYEIIQVINNLRASQ